MAIIADRQEREALARRAWHEAAGGHVEALLQVQCPAGHHVAKVVPTSSGSVVVTSVRAHSHGSRDRPDEPHTPTRPRDFVDLVEVADAAEDSIPAWCDCGQRSLSRSALRRWIAAGERRVILT
jgi:hypothetical protein